jgi:hypothetical protein
MLCRPRTLTPAALAARRANALKSTGPRTDQGKARVALNSLKHGRYAVNLPEKLARAGRRQGEAEWRQIRARIARTFQGTLTVPSPTGWRLRPCLDLGANLDSPEKVCATQREAQERANPDRHLGTTASLRSFERKMDWLANWVWCAHRNWQDYAGAKLKSPLESADCEARLTNQSRIAFPPQIRIHNPWARFGLVFYTQRRRGLAWRFMTRLLGGWPVPDPDAEMRPEMENGLRACVYPLGRPRFWERIRYCLDEEGNYHPEWQGRFRELRREMRNSGMAMWLEPHPLLAKLRQEEQREAQERSQC